MRSSRDKGLNLPVLGRGRPREDPESRTYVKGCTSRQAEAAKEAGRRRTDMEIIKTSRHQKIIGDFGELLVWNWLSRSGFEVALVDHTGIDILEFCD